MITSRRKHRSRTVQSEESEQSAPQSAQTDVLVDAPVDPQSEAKPIDSLEFEFAGPLRRIYAFAVDIGILLMIVFIVAPLGWAFNAQNAIIDVFIFLAYFIVPTGLFGRTIGKWVAGISVIDEEANKPGVALAIPREAVGRFVSVITFGIGLVWVIFDNKHQGWHDKIAGTYVVIVPNSGAPGFLARMFAPQDEKKPHENRRQRVGRPTQRRRRRNRRRN